MDYRAYPRHNVLCIDMRSFYASVEAVRLGLDPMTTLLAVVGDITRPGSIILATSPALKKKHGLKNISRFFELPKDPNIHIVPANMADYLHVSVQIVKLLNEFAPQEAIHPYSIDEIWITVDGLERLFGPYEIIAQKIQHKILNRFGITSAIGIGDNKFLAKVTLDIHAKKAKNGIAECRYEDVKDMLWPIPVNEIWGIGKRLTNHLHRLGITNLGDLALFSKDILKKHFGVMGEQLYYHAWGIDLSPVFGDFIKVEQDSFGHGISLLRDYTADDAHVCILELCEEACRRARNARKVGRTIHLGIGYSSEVSGGFHRSRSIPIPTNITLDMFDVCMQLFYEYYDGKSYIRRVYVTLTNLVDDGHMQLDLFTERSKQKEIGLVMDAIRKRYGTRAILRASSYTDAGITLERSQKIGGHWAQSKNKGQS